MIRAVIDTNVLFSSVFKRVGVPAQVLDLTARGILTPCLSDAVMADYGVEATGRGPVCQAASWRYFRLLITVLSPRGATEHSASTVPCEKARKRGSAGLPKHG
jgi:hypothetical protein